MSFEWKTVFYQAGHPIMWAVGLSLFPFFLFFYFLAVDTFLFISGSEHPFFKDSHNSFIEKIISFIPGSERLFYEGSYNSLIITIKVFVGSYIGAFIGEKLREFAFPDGIATTGFFATIGTRIFWLIGPQLLGCIIGVVALFWWGGVSAELTPTPLKATLAIAAVFIAKREYQLYKVRSRYSSFGPSAFRRVSLWLKGNWGIIAVVVAAMLLLERFERPKSADIGNNDSVESEAGAGDSLIPPEASGNDQNSSSNLEGETENSRSSEASIAEKFLDKLAENNTEPVENDSERVDEYQSGIEQIQKGQFDLCAKGSVGDLLANAFYDPTWEVQQSDEFNRVVIFRGSTEDRGNSPRVVMRFSYPTNDRWTVIDVFQDGVQRHTVKTIERICEIF